MISICRMWIYDPLSPLVILTEADIPFIKEVLLTPTPTWNRNTHSSDEYLREVEKNGAENFKKTPEFNKYSAHKQMYNNICGFFQHVNLTKNAKLEAYTVSLVPVDDPNWSNCTHLELLAHEILGHGMGAADEYNNRISFPFYDIIKKETGKVPEPDSLMYAESPKFKGKLRWYPRYLMPAARRKSNIPYTGNNSLLIDFLESSMKEIHDFGDLKDPVYQFDPEYQQEQLLKIIGR